MSQIVSSRCFDFCSARGIHYDCAKPKQEYSSWWFFTNPIEKYPQVKLDHFPIGRGEKNLRNLQPSQSLLFYYVNEAICIHVDCQSKGPDPQGQGPNPQGQGPNPQEIAGPNFRP